MSGFSVRKKGLKDFVTDIFFPNVCPFCEKVIPWNISCCEECCDEICSNADKAAENLCPVCGRFICKCDSERILYDRCFTAGIYEDKTRNAVLSMKYRNDNNAAEIFSELLYRNISSADSICFDLVTCVPMNSRKERKRGYNQAEKLAELLAEKLEVPMRNDLLIHSYSKVSQHDRNAEERRESVMTEYFASQNAELSGENILLCDDVMTTGSTLSRCAEILKDIGAESVTAAVCAAVIH